MSSASTAAAERPPHSSSQSVTRGGVCRRYTVIGGMGTPCGEREDEVVATTYPLTAVPFRCALARDELVALCRSMEHRRYLSQRPVLLRGEAADGLYIVVAGQVAVLIEDASGRELMLDLLGPGEIFGEVALLDGKPHPATFQAHPSCEVLFIPADAFWAHVSRNTAVLHMMLTVMACRRRYADLTIQRFAFMDVYDRVVTVLMERSCEEQADWVAAPGSRQIATSVGATREMVNRVIRDMIARGVVKRRGRTVLAVNRSSLCELSAEVKAVCPLAKSCNARKC